MATLEKPKAKKRVSSEYQRQQGKQQQTGTCNIDNDNLTKVTENSDMDELEQLILEPVTYDSLYDNSVTENRLSPELVQSLQSVKLVCLSALDSLLRQLVNTVSTTRKAERRLSDSSLQGKTAHHSLLGSIVESTNRLSSPEQKYMKRSDSTPAVTAFSMVQEVLTLQQTWLVDSTTDYDMCCSLAALLHHIYRLLELGGNSIKDDSSNKTGDATFVAATTAACADDGATNGDSIDESLQSTATIYTQLRESMSTFQKGKLTTLQGDDAITNEMAILWNEVDQLMSAITCLAQDRPVIESTSPPPAYNDVPALDTCTTTATINAASATSSATSFSSTAKTTKLKDNPPDYIQHNEKKQYDLNKLLSAIEQLSILSPQLNNQRVELNKRQAKELAAATIGKTIERLSRGRMDNQRALLPGVLSKQKMLQDLMNQIQRSSLRSMDSQRVSLNTKLKSKLNITTMNGILQFTHRSPSPEQQMIDDMTNMTDMLARMMHRPKYNQQRCSLSALKERDFFLNHIIQKVDRMENRRMSNQDAEWNGLSPLPQEKQASQQADTMEDELSFLFEHIHKSTSKMDNQRASFTSTSIVVSPATT